MVRLCSICFGEYERLARVLLRSTKQNSPNVSLEVEYFNSIDKDILIQTKGLQQVYRENVFKTKIHCQIVNESSDGELLCLIDCDTMVLNDLSPIQNYDFDLAYTIRPLNVTFPFNSGVVFVRVSKETKEWYQQWYKNTLTLSTNPVLFSKLRRKYGRINQCGLGMLLEQPHELKLQKLQCSIWNSIPDTWDEFNTHTKIVHILGQLRQAALYGRGTILPKAKNILKIWKSFDLQEKQ